MTIYTRRGDEGRTELRNRERVSKTSPRIEAYGTVDELNAWIGSCRQGRDADIDSVLADIQHDLHVLQAELANPQSTEDDPGITPEATERIEAVIDTFDEELDPLTSFILPGGSEMGARFHLARTVCRRAERKIIGLDETTQLSAAVLAYINRLSDLLFVLARTINARAGVSEESPSY